MIDNCLILGYGSAGMRHYSYLYSAVGRDARIVTADPDPERKPTTTDVDSALGEKWDIAVIASPPRFHLDQIAALLHVNPACKIMCEKPICSIGQLEDAYSLTMAYDTSGVLVSYNWRYHTYVKTVRELVFQHTSIDSGLEIAASQSRVLPAWGILEDHVSHDIDIIVAIDGIESIEEAAHTIVPDRHGKPVETFSVRGKTPNAGPFTITDTVHRSPVPRQGTIAYGVSSFPLGPDKGMFLSMWNRFMSESRLLYPGVGDALVTQSWLEEIARISNVKV